MTRQDLLRYFNRKLKTFVASNYKMSSALFCVLRSIVCGIVSVKALAIPYIRPNPPIIVIIGGAKLLDIDTGRPAAVDWETSVVNIFRGSIIFPPGSVLPLSFLCHLMPQKTHAVSERPINSASGRTDGEIGK
jgi:hypothetical protein